MTEKKEEAGRFTGEYEKVGHEPVTEEDLAAIQRIRGPVPPYLTEK